jgi:hypothetical protein
MYKHSRMALRMLCTMLYWAHCSGLRSALMLRCCCIARLGGQSATEAHCTALVVGVRKAAPCNRRARLFGRCLGLLEPAVPQAGEGCTAAESTNVACCLQL